MNQTHVHLLITHLPIFGSFFGAMVLAYGLFSKSYSTKIAAYLLLIISAAGAGIAYLTGEGAEETVEDLPGVTEAVIEQHEDFAIFALIGLVSVGVLSLVGAYFTAKKSSFTKTFAYITLALSVIAFGLVARTGYLGGQIRHTEIREGYIPTTATEAPNNQINKHESEEDND